MNKNDESTGSAGKSNKNFRIQVTGGARQTRHRRSRKLTLVCEGGGQRGIFTAGILDSFMRQNFFPFQALLGTSAGAQNLTAYACDQRGYARDAIFRYTTDKAFFNPLRFARGGHLIDLDWYFSALNQEMPLDIEKGKQRLAGRSFHMSASRRATLQADYLSFDSSDVYQSIKASCAIPLLYREGVALDGVDYWDGGVADSLPVQLAHDRGSDCMVVIRTQPRETFSALKMVPKNWRVGGLQEMVAMADSYMTNYNASMDFIESPPDHVKVIDIAPIAPLKSRMLGSSFEGLEHDYQLGQLCGHEFLEQHAWRL